VVNFPEGGVPAHLDNTGGYALERTPTPLPE
jgi:hypothetical protein